MKVFIKNFMKYRFLLGELIKKGIKLKYRRSYLGIFWTLLEPLMTMIVLTVVFGSLLGRGDATYPVYILSGRLLYSFFSTATKSSLKSIRANAGMIKKVYVPKYMYPLSEILYNYIIFLISLIVLVGVGLFLGVYPTWHVIEAVIPLLNILILTLGIGMILATLAVFFRDLEYLWTVALQLIMYASAIFYHAKDIIRHRTNIIWIFKLNPLYACIENFRNAVFGRPMDKFATVYAFVFGVSCLLIGTFIFYKKQDEFILQV